MVSDELVRTSISAVIEEGRVDYAMLKSARGVIEIAKALIVIIPRTVELVEKTSKNLNLRGEDKKDLAVQILNSMIPYPWWLKWMGEETRKEILGAMVDGAVSIFNRFWKKGKK